MGVEAENLQFLSRSRKERGNVRGKFSLQQLSEGLALVGEGEWSAGRGVDNLVEW